MSLCVCVWCVCDCDCVVCLCRFVCVCFYVCVWATVTNLDRKKVEIILKINVLIFSSFFVKDYPHIKVSKSEIWPKFIGSKRF